MLFSHSSASDNSLLSTTPTTPFWQAGTLPDPWSATGQALGSSSQSLAFIDTRLADYQTLEKGLQPGTAIYELNPQQDELAQITQTIARYSNISTLSIFSHGNEGSLQLGDLNLNLGDLGSYASELHSWQQALAPGADLLFSGCNVAAGDDGKAFVQQIHQLTGADVAASTDLTGNSATNFGGGIYNIGTLNASNSTFSSNKATLNGGGIWNGFGGTAALLFNTLTLNRAANGGGVFNDSTGGSFKVQNTIIAANLLSAGGMNLDVSGIFDITNSSYNLIGDGTGGNFTNGVNGNKVGTKTAPINPLLGPLKKNGGLTATHALLPGSPAIDAGNPTLLDTDPITDQRGEFRVNGGRADIGAFEL